MILGLLIGFYGYLFPSNINLMILELYRSKKYDLLFLISVLVVVFESLYCFFTLRFLANSLDAKHFNYLEKSAYILMLIMGCWMIFEKKTTRKAQKNMVYRGLISTIFHPQQIFFWTFMGIIFESIKIISKDVISLGGFVIFNAVGTVLVLGCYAFWGDKLMSILDLKMYQLNKVIGVLYVGIALKFIIF